MDAGQKLSKKWSAISFQCLNNKKITFGICYFLMENFQDLINITVFFMERKLCFQSIYFALKLIEKTYGCFEECEASPYHLSYPL